ELDENYDGVNTTTFIWDVQDLNAPFLLGTFVSTTPAIDHNLYIKDNLCYQSNYRAGLRIASLDNIASGTMTEVGFFDVYPSSDGAAFNGTWSNFPYFASGVIAVSHIEEGLFLLSLSGSISDLGCTDPAACNYDPEAIEDNGLCAENDVCGVCGGNGSSCLGCTNTIACNYDPSATIDDGSCIIGGTGINITVGGGSWDSEITWSIVQDDNVIIADETTGSIEICIGDGCYTFAMNDSYGDGWNGAIYTITNIVTGAVIDSGDLDSAAIGDGSYSGENTFCIEGGEPDVPGCTNATACNYDATATIDDGSCDYTSCAGCTDATACNYDATATIDDGLCEYESCACIGDVNGDGAITVADILVVLSEFGCASDCSADVDGDGSVTVSDVLEVLSVFGNPC
ncbi:MAG: choice-of-anchor B family protein, partial [Flavobacteriales bacterium]|nr:choice-of-anchor B family protein [Flavobacteriales bacterium]